MVVVVEAGRCGRTQHEVPQQVYAEFQHFLPILVLSHWIPASKCIRRNRSHMNSLFHTGNPSNKHLMLTETAPHTQKTWTCPLLYYIIVYLTSTLLRLTYLTVRFINAVRNESHWNTFPVRLWPYHSIQVLVCLLDTCKCFRACNIEHEYYTGHGATCSNGYFLVARKFPYLCGQ